MEEKIIFELNSIYRDNLRIKGYKFGDGEDTVCVVGSMRGNEIQQLFACSQLIKTLKKLEESNELVKGKSIMVIPCVNPYSMNIQKRFWSTDNTDINRMFPGYDLGETTQRIAGGLFEKIKGYKIGIQFASFYLPGDFIPHVRMMKTGFENTEMAKLFGLPYIFLRNTRPFDTTTLNYNWQLWNTNAFSLYAGESDKIDIASTQELVHAILTFLNRIGVTTFKSHNGYYSEIIEDAQLVSVRTKTAGFFRALAKTNDIVEKGDIVARILDPYTGEISNEIKTPVTGTVFFTQNSPLAYANSVIYKIIDDDKKALENLQQQQ